MLPRRRNPKGAWGLRAISALLVVNDVPASPPPRALISPCKPHARGLLYFHHGLLGEVTANCHGFSQTRRVRVNLWKPAT